MNDSSVTPMNEYAQIDRNTPIEPQASFSINQLELGAPIATLRSLGALRDSRGHRTGTVESETDAFSSFDLISLSILTDQEATTAFNMYDPPSSLWARFGD